MSIPDPVPEREDDVEEEAVIGSDIVPHSNTNEGTEAQSRTQETTDSAGSIQIGVARGAGFEYIGDLPNDETDLDRHLTPDSDIHDRTTELESRVSILEEEVESRVSILEEEVIHRDQRFEEYYPNDSFQDAVEQSLVNGGLLHNPEIQSQLDSSNVGWQDFSPEDKNRIKRASLEPVHDLAVLFGTILSGLGTVGSALLGFHLLSLIFLVMTAFLYYSYRTGLGQ